MPDAVLTDQPVVFIVIEKDSKRSKKTDSHATISQVGDTFTRGTHQHIGQADVKLPLKAEISSNVRKCIHTFTLITLINNKIRTCKMILSKCVILYYRILCYLCYVMLLHHNSTVVRRVTMVRTERGVRLTICQGDVS